MTTTNEANQFLRLALAAHLPTVHVKTDELLHVKEIIEHINEGPVFVLPNGVTDVKNAIENHPKGSVFMLMDEAITPKIYMMLKSAGDTCIWVNTKLHPLHLVTGQMVAPIEMVREELAKHAAPGQNIEDLLPAVGGLTLKDVFECSKLTLRRDGHLSANNLSKTRQGYPQKLKGISQISSAFDFYDVPSALQTFVGQSLRFFHEPAPLNQLAPRGLLFDGPPGTGKTMAAKYLADHLGVPLYRLDIASMKGKYVGDSEGALAGALAQLDQASPCVVLIDEVEKFFQQGAFNGDSGVTSGLLGSMLWWLQEHSSRVLTVMTTNDSSKLPPELHREGRVDTTLTFNGLPSYETCKAFAGRVLASLEARFSKLTPEEQKSLVNEVGDKLHAAANESAVPQVKVTQMVTDAYKVVIAARTPVVN